MFTGLVGAVGRLGRTRPRGAGLTVAIVHELPGGPLADGESVNVDGCCLTVSGTAPGQFTADLSPETLSRTGGRPRWRPGRPVNLERALAAGDRIGGHVVQGHADGLVRVLGIRRAAGGWATLRVDRPAAARGFVVPKGSVALDGVSLTVSRTGPGWFEVALIPATLGATTLGARRPGDRLVVEWDMLARVAAEARSRKDTEECR